MLIRNYKSSRDLFLKIKRTAIHSIVRFHQLGGEPSPSDHPLAKGILAGAQRFLAHQTTKKGPITVSRLELARQIIQKEELLLQQKKEKLRMETELAKGVIEESVYFKGERSPSLSLPRQLPTSTPQETKEESDKVNDSPTVPIAETNLSSLNPEASEWQRSNESEENISETSITHHLSVSDKNATEMLDIERLQQQQNKQIQELLKQQQQQTLALTFPQPEVPVFSGDPTEYLDFTRAFENLIESKTSDPSMKLYYLVQYAAGDVRQLMRGCLPTKPEEG